MVPNNATIDIAKTNCEFLCDVETLLGLVCVFPLLKLGQGLSKFALRYDPGIMGVMPWAVGYLTGKNTQRCRAFLGECRAVFVDLFHFLLFLVTFFTGRKFCKLLFTSERV
jgi:hypothetical protein